MKQFLTGLVLGGAGGGITWLLTQQTVVTVVVGLAIALIVWGAWDGLADLLTDIVD